MKKLIMAAAIVCAAASVHAAAGVLWIADEGLTPLSSCVGGLDESCVTAYLWTFAAADWDSTYETSKGVYDAFKNGTLSAGNAEAAQWEGNVSYWATSATTAGTAYSENEQYYAAILYLHNDNASGNPDYYMGNWGTELALKGTDPIYEYGQSVNLGTVQGGTSALQSGGGATSWTATAVPEPTSGLLLLLGVAGLALRRRRA